MFGKNWKSQLKLDWQIAFTIILGTEFGYCPSSKKRLLPVVQVRIIIFCSSQIFKIMLFPGVHGRKISETSFKMKKSFLQHVTLDLTNVLVFLFIGDGLTLCQRMHQDALSSSEQDIYVPQCSLEGSFVEVQCHGSSNECWCVDQQGSELNGTRRKEPLKCTGFGVLNLCCIILFILSFSGSSCNEL